MKAMIFCTKRINNYTVIKFRRNITMSSNSKFINAYLDLCKGSHYYIADEDTNTTPKTKVMESYLRMFSISSDAAINKHIDKYSEIYNSIFDQDPVYLLDCSHIFVRLLKGGHLDMIKPVKDSYLKYRNAFSIDEIEKRLSDYYLTVFKIVTGFGVTRFYSPRDFTTAWSLSLANGVEPISQIADNMEEFQPNMDAPQNIKL